MNDLYTMDCLVSPFLEKLVVGVFPTSMYYNQNKKIKELLNLCVDSNRNELSNLVRSTRF